MTATDTALDPFEWAWLVETIAIVPEISCLDVDRPVIGACVGWKSREMADLEPTVGIEPTTC
jgi:hypothetical protein